jgi:hypothetical protein
VKPHLIDEIGRINPSYYILLMPVMEWDVGELPTELRNYGRPSNAALTTSTFEFVSLMSKYFSIPQSY